MLDFATLLHPISTDQFYAEHHDKAPLHVPAGPEAPKADLLDWATFNRLLDQTSLWSAANLKLVQNTDPVPPEDYCRLNTTQSGQVLQPDPAKVALHLADGASLIAGDAQTLTAPLSGLTRALADAFSAAIGANIYCSFKGVRAFSSHYDLHHVFAVQVEGEKVWRLYANRERAPVDYPADSAETRRWMERNRGPVWREIRMRPGDVLYLPRGWYHDALAEDGPSLHVTFSVTPLYGRVLFSLLEQAALQDPMFRDYFPSADRADALKAHLSRLGDGLAQLCKSQAFFEEIAMTQERLKPRRAAFALPATPPLTQYRPTGAPRPPLRGPVVHAMEWAYAQPSFTLESLMALFDFVAEDDIRHAVSQAEAVGALARA